MNDPQDAAYLSGKCLAARHRKCTRTTDEPKPGTSCWCLCHAGIPCADETGGAV